MARNNYSYEKRRRENEKRKKKEAKKVERANRSPEDEAAEAQKYLAMLTGEEPEDEMSDEESEEDEAVDE